MTLKIHILRIGSCPTDKHPGQGIALHKLAQSPALRTFFVFYDKLGEIPLTVSSSDCTMIGVPFRNPTMPRRRSGIRFWWLQMQRAMAILRFSMKARQAVRDKKIDILHLHTPQHFLLLWWAHRRGIPTVVTFHGTDFMRVSQSRILRLVLRKVTCFLCMNQEQVRAVRKFFPKTDVRYIANGVDFQSFQAGAERPRSKSIVAVGNLRWQKDFATLIEAFSTLSNKFPDWTLRILGEGPDRAELTRMIETFDLQDRVFLHGTVSREEVRDTLNSSSIFALSSQSEGLPKALLEAMAAGCACVSTDVGGCAEVLKGYGLVVPPTSIASLANALTTLMANPLVRAQTAQACTERAKEFSWQHYIDTHLEVYRALVLHTKHNDRQV